MPYMSTKQQIKLEMVIKVISGTMSRDHAQGILNISQRTLERYLADYRNPVFMPRES
ncbi:MAG: hypothetical protein ABIQ95_13455 [Bdellovibrionia bacterium]